MSLPPGKWLKAFLERYGHAHPFDVAKGRQGWLSVGLSTERGQKHLVVIHDYEGEEKLAIECYYLIGPVNVPEELLRREPPTSVPVT